MKSTKLLITSFALCLGVTGCTVYEYEQDRIASKIPPSSSIRAAQYSPQANDLEIKLKSHSALRGAKIKVDWTSKNSLALKGTASSKEQKRRAEQIVRKLFRGPVTNELKVVE